MTTSDKLAEEAHKGDAEAGHDEGGSLLNMVGPEGKNERHQEGEDVNGYRHELRVSG